jgi:hypothetical protein
MLARNQPEWAPEGQVSSNLKSHAAGPERSTGGPALLSQVPPAPAVTPGVAACQVRSTVTPLPLAGPRPRRRTLSHWQALRA